MTRFQLNGRAVAVDLEPDMPLLWALRDALDVKGPKFGCGIGECGACTVHLDGEPVPACLTPLAAVAGRRVLTIEGLARGARLHPVQQAWIDHQVPQCGYCQGGQILAAVALLARNPEPSDQEIDAAMTHICRCGTYARMRVAIREAGKKLSGKR